MTCLKRPAGLTFVLIFNVLLFPRIAYPQESKTLFGPDTDIGFAWSLELKTGSIQDDMGTLYAAYGGALINHSILIGFTGGMNLSHSEVNHGYLGLLAQYTHKPDDLLHWSTQLLLGIGRVTDYKREKTSMMDNFGNYSGGSRFYLVEPGVNGELNFTDSVRLVVGLSYRLASGIDEGNVFINTSKVNDSDMSGLHFNLGVKIGAY
ncbi:hypothetical protein ACFLT7_08355 [candidate division KSB1 bacterium]